MKYVSIWIDSGKNFLEDHGRKGTYKEESFSDIYKGFK